MSTSTSNYENYEGTYCKCGQRKHFSLVFGGPVLPDPKEFFCHYTVGVPSEPETYIDEHHSVERCIMYRAEEIK